jgi:hypothetical protein
MKKYHGFLYIGFYLAIVFQACKEPIEPLPELTVTTLQTNIEYGGTATILWAAINATACSLDAGNIIGVSGSFTTPPLTKTTTYSFTAVGPGGTVTVKITIQVNAAPKPILKVTVDNDTIGKGQTVNLLIESKNAIGVTIKGIIPESKLYGISYNVTEKTFDALNGKFTSWPLVASTNFTVTATGIDGTQTINSAFIFVPTIYDTLSNFYWVFQVSLALDGQSKEWQKFYFDEDMRTRKWFLYKDKTYERFKKDGTRVGNGTYSIKQDTLTTNNDNSNKFKLSLIDTTLMLYNMDSTVVTFYKGY